MINGFIVIDKPAGISSHDVVNRVRRILGTRKVGHTGTLDPFATGVLPVAVNDGTKAIHYLDEGIKRYEALLKLGVTTDTLDITGTVQSTSDSGTIRQSDLEELLPRFSGVIEQIPPMYSAIKQGGQPLYKLARQGVEVARKSRQVEIASISITRFTPPFVAMTVSCSRGTYVRTLADDMGRALGCGAVLQELRRTASGPFVIEDAILLDTLHELASRNSVSSVCLTPYRALAHLADIPLAASGLEKMRHGRSPEWQDTLCLESIRTEVPLLARLSDRGELVGMAELVPDSGGNTSIKIRRVLSAV